MNRSAPTSVAQAEPGTGQGTEPDAFEILANGESRRVTRGTTVSDFLTAHDLSPDLVVVERNGAILRRAEVGVTALHPGDTLEIVHFVGGG
jgi:thiamine biosynthesis protein ThiS